MGKYCTVIAFCLTCSLAVRAVAATWYVAPAPTGGDGQPGTAAEPFATINYAISAAAEGDEICIQAGTYLENVRNDSAASGKNGLQFRGGYAADWSRNLKTQKTIVKAADATKTVFYVNTKTNLLNGLTLTGGKYGFECATSDTGKFQYLYQCVISNNTAQGMRAASACKVAVVSSLFYKNVIGGYGGADNNNPLYFYNCTFAGHTDSALYHGDEYGRELKVYNCVFDDNKYHVWHNWVYSHAVAAYDSCFGNVKSGGRTTDGKGNGSVLAGWSTIPGLDIYRGNCMYRPVRLNADFTLSDDSCCLKRGADRSANAIFVYDEDIVGNKWGDDWDMGCYKSSAPLVALPNNAHSYASPSGDDANSGLDAEHPKKTVLAAVNELGENGTCHLADGTYVGTADTAFIHRPGIKVVGESVDGTIVKSSANSSPTVLNGCFYVNASSVVISNLTMMGGSCGVAFGYPPVASNSVVSHCAISNCYYGVFTLGGSGSKPGCVSRVSKCRLVKNGYGVRIHAPCVVDNCLIVGSTAYDGVFYRIDKGNGGEPSALINCTIMNSARHGIFHGNDNIEQNYLINCIFANNKSYGVERSMQRSYDLYPKLYNCAFTNNVSGNINKGGAGESGLNNLLYPGTLGFMTKTGFEYVPARLSPLIKQGVTNGLFAASLVETDMEDRPRRNYKIDLGCRQHTYFDGLTVILR